MLKGKNVLLGVTGSIAAYKAVYLVRLLKKRGALVRVVQTKSSLDFVSPLTFTTISNNEVLIDMIDDSKNKWNNHVDLSLWADIMIIAPLTAKTMSKMVEGNCDNLLLATYLSAKCPVYFAPAMDLDMYKHPSTKNNISKLKEFGNGFIPANHGELASGLVGEGRMAEPEEIIEFVLNDFYINCPLNNKECLVTAGPTYEDIDPVRYIGNRSTGRMGLVIAEELANQGANVNLIMGPSILKSDHPRVNQINITNAKEMFFEVEKYFKRSYISIFSAAVSDYKPKRVFAKKIKKKDPDWTLDLSRNKDIVSAMSKNKSSEQFVVGFALETDNAIDNAIDKLKRKNLDLIVLNSMKDKGAGFGYETNKVTIIDKKLKISKFDIKDKVAVASDIVSSIISQLKKV